MIDVGEETGDLDVMLVVADNYDEEVDVAVQALLSLLEPMLVVILGVVVGTIVLALFLPLVSMIESVSNPVDGRQIGVDDLCVPCSQNGVRSMVRHGGFTLAELIVVMGIIAVLVTVLVVVVGGARESGGWPRPRPPWPR